MRRQFLLAFGALVLAAPLAAQHGAAGYVSAVQGRWVVYGGGLHGQSEVKLGMSVPAGSVIAFVGDAPGSARIVVRRFDGEALARECSVRAGCGDPLRVTAGQHGAGPVRRLMEAVAALLEGHPERYVPLISRRGAGDWTPAVVALHGDTVQLGPVLAGTPGPLSLRLVALAGDTRSTLAPLDLAWDDGAAAAVLAGVRPGLYRLVSLRSPPRETWVLLLPPDDAARAQREMAQTVALVGEWGSDAWVEADTFLRAYLQHLAGEP
jgi:hypothetical protein